MKEKNISVLIVDGYRPYTQRMKILLKELKHIYPVTIAGTYREAWLKLETGDHDLVLLDIHLPDGNGIDLLKQISNQQSNRNRKVIMISNKTDTFYKTECKKLGAKYFLDKTNDFDKVADLITDNRELSFK